MGNLRDALHTICHRHHAPRAEILPQWPQGGHVPGHVHLHALLLPAAPRWVGAPGGGDAGRPRRRDNRPGQAYLTRISDDGQGFTDVYQLEDIKFKFLTSPLKIKNKGKDVCLRCIKMELGEPDDSGRRRPIEIKDSEFDINADIVIFAIGQEIDADSLKKNTVKLTDKKLIDIDPITYQTSQEDVFAGGDAVTGPASAVEAIGAGHEVAESILRCKESSETGGPCGARTGAAAYLKKEK